jgi:hypothetical protein
MGRWVIVQPRTRQAFSAVGLDVIPDVVKLLTAALAGADEKALRFAVPHTSADQIERLEEVGLLVNSEEPGEEPGESMLWHYHLASYDYPFLDYADPDWREDEDQIIKSYMRMWPAPPPIDTYTGESFSLPPPSSESLNVGSGLSLEVLATVLHYTFAPIGEIPTQAVTCIRRTSASGGARHPTECRVILPEGCGPLEAGVYLYDNGLHALVRETGENLDSYGQYKDARVVFVLRSKVERAMWRYRDLRALRPVLLDAGHIVETLSLLLAKAGIDAQMCPPLGETGQRTRL